MASISSTRIKRHLSFQQLLSLGTSDKCLEHLHCYDVSGAKTCFPPKMELLIGQSAAFPA
jgi:hypothetical protein